MRIILLLAGFLVIQNICAQDNTTREYYSNGRLKAMGHIDKDGVRQGEWTFYSFRDTIQEVNSKFPTIRGSYSDGIEIGSWYHYYPNSSITSSLKKYKTENAVNVKAYTYKNYGYDGKLKESGSIVDNEKQGKFFTYYNNGQPQVLGNYKSGRKDGNWKTYKIDGSLSSEYTTVNGANQGSYISYWSTDVIKSKGNFDKGKKSGEWFYYDTNGKIQKKEIYNEDQTHSQELFYPNGEIKETSTRIGLHSVGKKLAYYDNGNLKAEYNYNNSGKLDGKVIGYNKDGSVDIQKRYIDGKTVDSDTALKSNRPKPKSCVENQGIMECTTFYRESGNKRAVTYYRGDVLLSSKKYHDNGSLSRECTLDDEKVNTCKTYNENGLLTSQVSHKNGKPFGTWNYYDAEGNIERKIDN